MGEKWLFASGNAGGADIQDCHSLLKETFGDSLKMEKMLLKSGQILILKDAKF